MNIPQVIFTGILTRKLGNVDIEVFLGQLYNWQAGHIGTGSGGCARQGGWIAVEPSGEAGPASSGSTERAVSAGERRLRSA